jgi:hypothetical protein
MPTPVQFRRRRQQVTEQPTSAVDSWFQMVPVVSTKHDPGQRGLINRPRPRIAMPARLGRRHHDQPPALIEGQGSRPAG